MPTERIPLAVDLTTRDGSLNKDSKTVNAVFENVGNNHMFTKRPGLKFITTITSNSGTVGTQAMSAFNNSILSIINNNIYKYVPLTNTTTTIGSLGTTT